MTEAEQVAETQRWLRYSREDLLGGETLLRQPGSSPRHVCWLAQQAAEKALKAVLVFSQIDFPKTHDLDALRNLLPDGWCVKGEFPDLAELAEWAVEARYPGDWPDAGVSDARSALQQAQAIWSAVIADLSSRGVPVEDTPS